MANLGNEKMTPNRTMALLCSVAVIGLSVQHGLPMVFRAVPDCRAYDGPRMVEGRCLDRESHGPFKTRLAAVERAQTLRETEQCGKPGPHVVMVTLNSSKTPSMWTVYCPERKN